LITKTKIATAFATGALLLSSFAPAAFANGTIDVSGNGAGSDTSVQVSSDQSSRIVQNNDANISNTINNTANTGGNSSSFNTGGNSTIDTGNASSRVDVSNMANMNQASIDGCGCTSGGTGVSVSGNGAFSSTDVNVDHNTDSAIYQDNNARIRNNISSNQTTGNNDSGFNTGGDTRIVTGHAMSDVMVDNAANANTASIGGGSGSGNGGGSYINVSGNGAFSNTDVDLSNRHSSTIDQNSTADFYNNIRNTDRTGGNDSNFNTGGNSWIASGNATNRVGVDNMANFNAASLDCGCMTGLTARVSGNGAFASTDLAANFDQTKSLFQDNRYTGNNRIYNDSQTGNNSSGYNTGSGRGMILSGHSGSDVSVSNAGNANFAGGMGNFTMPGGTRVNIAFDMMKMWQMFNMM